MSLSTSPSPLPSLLPDHARLLAASGVHSLDELARNQPEKLLRWMEEVNAEQRLVRRLPDLGSVREWVEHARTALAA
jgi:hypothetical protein